MTDLPKMETPSKAEMQKRESTIALAAKDALTFVKRAQEFEVKDQPTYQKASKVVSYLAGKHRELEGIRKWFTAPLNTHVKAINARFKEITLPIGHADRIMRGKMGDFNREQEDIRREEARKIEEDNQKRLEKAKKPERVKIKEAPAPVETRTENTAIRKVWTFEILKEIDIPTKYMTPDTPAIRQAIRDGEREIPGLRIFQKEQIAIR